MNEKKTRFQELILENLKLNFSNEAIDRLVVSISNLKKLNPNNGDLETSLLRLGFGDTIIKNKRIVLLFEEIF